MINRHEEERSAGAVEEDIALNTMGDNPVPVPPPSYTNRVPVPPPPSVYTPVPQLDMVVPPGFKLIPLSELQGATEPPPGYSLVKLK